MTSPYDIPATAIDRLVRALSGKGRTEAALYKTGPGTRALLAHELLLAGARPVLVVRGAAELHEMLGVLQLFQSQEEFQRQKARWVVLPPFLLGGGREQAAQRTLRKDAWARRIAALWALQTHEGRVGVICTVDNFLPWWPPRNFLDTNHLVIKSGEELPSDLIIEQAITWGYERSTLVSRPGELSRRGDILDIFTPGHEHALRLEFFGDTVEEMRLFDPVTQRSHAMLKEAVLLPVRPLAVTAQARQEALARFKALRTTKRIDPEEEKALRLALEEGGAGLTPGVFYETPAVFEDWLPGDRTCLQASPELFAAVLEEQAWAWEKRAEEGAMSVLLARRRALHLRSTEQALKGLQAGRTLLFQSLVMGLEREGDEAPEHSIDSFEQLMRLDREEQPQDEDTQRLEEQRLRDRPWQALVERLKIWSRSRRQTLLCFSSEQGRKKFLALAAQDGIIPATSYATTAQGLFALLSPFAKGADLQWNGMRILGEDVLQPRGAVRPAVSRKEFIGLRQYEELTPGDLLVHRDYGLGRFQGLVRLDLGGVGNDFLLMHYAGDDKLYLPVDRLGLVQRFKGPEEIEPALDKLGGIGWARTREKARKAVEQIAGELVEMYAWRKVAKGFTYGPENELFREFEASFGFEETPDQAQAIQDVLDDMARPEPMDRLVCGDVGFGKTEVAMRAAVRAALESRQTAILCPTTVLAEQHFQNFKARLKDLPITVAMLSRFVTARQQRAILEQVKRGQVDILIGTHRLLSRDIQIPNLSLLVLDEEQRFGVKHKERLKEFKKNVDALTLTATPIPRTLQLSLSGIRSLSIIETPPRERKAVESALIEREPKLLKRILEQELAREGQVFWVYNRVQGLEQVVDFVKQLVPGARVAMAHGQMAEKQLEETMHAFWHGELDILVCTSIVESGLDFPRANTMVVDQAQLFGLGQLYQLRGRVGRSDRQAYTYFVTPSIDQLAEKTRKRLQIIMDMDYLGAGFQVAMEDLRLRGAGNILGESQSGHIAKVGLDLFLEMLEMEVSRLRGTAREEVVEPELQIGFAAHIPEHYMPDSRERLKYYKGFTSIHSPEVRQELQAEVRDRFGPLPEELSNFLAVLDFKRQLAQLGVHKADLFPGKVKLSWGESSRALDPARLVAWVAGQAGRARLMPPSTLELRLDENVDMVQRLQQVGDAIFSLKA
ncbi:transcription-repair coupling factor [Megalodesulfovibrio gigas]|uniref:Transcription-repair-coupling factor n=1 Tax=Megalodesulfovibrio gigas (strain ATCC 19364 / DSM 1382 / NCIMB 9332 / VKM B-1759) TaxID=1121448 RepID=T2GBD7_MEGG1|nr:transcription-repair coupling factor [Megalodesulfovibrio gigas]AGW13489.1 putative transcription-repair coupling factor [Megalodesulfovibrio gigas DSM 1382 = ATCC 19364]